MTEPDDIVSLTSAGNEAEAVAIVARLEAEGIKAQSVGGLTAGFRAEAPGYVQIIVPRADLERARKILAEIQAK